MFLSSILPLVLLMTIYLSAATANRDHDCFVGHRYHRHSELFSMPNQSHCIKYICWYGRVIRRIEACEVEGECHRVGSTFDFKCTRYRCNKVDRGSFMYYQPEIISTRCQDFNGQCRREGETFPFQMHGTYYPSCTCITSQTSIRYRCTSVRPARRRFSVNGSGQGNNIGSESSSGHSYGFSLGGASGGPYSNGGEEDSEVSISVNPVRVER